MYRLMGRIHAALLGLRRERAVRAPSSTWR